VKNRSVLRTTFRWLFFGAWLTLGLLVVAWLLFGSAGDRYEQFANVAAELDFESVAPDEPGAAIAEENAEEVADPWGGAFSNTIGGNIAQSQGLGMSGSGKGGGGTGTGIGGDGGKIVHGYGSGKAAARPNEKKVTINLPGSSSPAETETSNMEDAEPDVDHKLANLPLGSIAFNTPETIPYGDDARIELLVSLKEAEEQLREAVRAAGPVETARVKISDQMEARLTGLGFRIEAITPERQAVTRGEPTQWQWQIEPNKSATLELHLTLSALIEVDGVPATRAVRTFERTIYVEVPLVHRVTDFLTGHLELLLSFVLIPVAGGVYRHVRNKRKQNSVPSDQAPPNKQAA